MIDLSKFNATQILLLKAVADYECGQLICDECPFHYNDGGCVSLELMIAFNERRERDKD